MEWYLPVIWAGAHRHRGRHVRHPRRLRSRHRHPVSASRRRMRTRPDDGSVAPFWDGNETWLVLGGGGLLVAFPKAYAVIMPAFYLPVIVMLLALVFRGVAFEFRTVLAQQDWLEFAFAARLDARGVLPGRHPRRPDPGLPVATAPLPAAHSTGRRRSRCCAGWRDRGYALLGATWLAMKTEGAVGRRAPDAQAKMLLLCRACSSWRW